MVPKVSKWVFRCASISIPKYGTPENLFLAILLILVIFPLKFPLKPKNFTANGRKCPTAKTKTVLKSVNKTEQLVGMYKSKREKVQNHPTGRPETKIMLRAKDLCLIESLIEIVRFTIMSSLTQLEMR